VSFIASLITPIQYSLLRLSICSKPLLAKMLCSLVQYS
jgi:xanthosine utilization system XapX-like protein